MQELFQNNFIDVLKNEYAEFSGRKNRRDYWMYVLCVFLINVALGIIIGIFSRVGFLSGLFTTLQSLVGLALLVPGLGMSVRRLHDIGKDWTALLFLLIPLVGWIIVLVFLAQEGQRADNQFGPYVG